MPKKETIKKTNKKETVAKKKPVTKVLAEKKTELKPKTKKLSLENNGLGKKFTCYSCGTKFYDFGKEDKICPKCSADQNVKPVVKQKIIKAKISEFDVVDENVIPRGLGEEDMLLDPDAEVDENEEIENGEERE